ncbi:MULTISPECIES: (d)CMP kinase [Candidatus Ichthyocystis]|uniref:Cytidylate kinase n=1 Tax=Candidatus Ichthyocystis hellenicum TaxID=1561003 RepID=A0A0S4M2S8_9BURK|nr:MULTISPECIES: (d)CMP kinase [Ichthyocystis]CUT17998.1 Cytidylate kinase [Candidatus Ichthyocystis hellenicum]
MNDYSGIPPVVAIDGPSASGKGAVSVLVSRSLGFNYLESGLLYRVVGAIVLKNKLKWEDKLIHGFISDQKISWDNNGYPLVNGCLFSGLYDPEVSLAASRVAKIGLIRDILLKLQQDCRQNPGLVAEGRDMGTVVFPDARLKIFLTAIPEVRAKRRFLQLKERGGCVKMSEVLEEILLRDSYDSTRKVSSLRVAEDAIVIDSTNMSVNRVVDEVLRYVSQRIL